MKLCGISIAAQKIPQEAKSSCPTKESRGEMIDLREIVSFGVNTEALRRFHCCTNAVPERKNSSEKKKPRRDDRCDGDRFFRSQK